jgi:HAE1 family hydrophobic/amphiphilic exporter-1
MSNTELSWFVDNTSRAPPSGPRGRGPDRSRRRRGPEINVTVDPARLAALGVTAPQINEALRGFVVDTSGGRRRSADASKPSASWAKAETVDALRKLTIPTQGGFVRLADVAEIGDGQAEERGFARLNGVPVVAFQVSKTQESSDIAVEALGRGGAGAAPGGVPADQLHADRLHRRRHQAQLRSHPARLIEGMILAALVVLAFLREWRATAITVIAMPASLIPTFAGMLLLGFSLNVVTLLSLTLVIGILVDDAIVEIENIQKRVERGETPYQAAITGPTRSAWPLWRPPSPLWRCSRPSASCPAFPGQYFIEFGLTVSMAVLFSLVVARLLTPLLAAYFLKASSKTHAERKLPRFYEGLLQWALRHRWMSLGFGVLYFVGTIFVVSQLQAGFFPEEDPGYYYLNVEGPPGATREDMEQIVQLTTDKLETRSEIENVFRPGGLGGRRRSLRGRRRRQHPQRHHHGGAEGELQAGLALLPR